jgi:hypothetical protein
MRAARQRCITSRRHVPTSQAPSRCVASWVRQCSVPESVGCQPWSAASWPVLMPCWRLWPGLTPQTTPCGALSCATTGMTRSAVSVGTSSWPRLTDGGSLTPVSGPRRRRSIVAGQRASRWMSVSTCPEPCTSLARRGGRPTDGWSCGHCAAESRPGRGSTSWTCPRTWRSSAHRLSPCTGRDAGRADSSAAGWHAAAYTAACTTADPDEGQPTSPSQAAVGPGTAGPPAQATERDTSHGTLRAGSPTRCALLVGSPPHWCRSD